MHHEIPASTWASLATFAGRMAVAPKASAKATGKPALGGKSGHAGGGCGTGAGGFKSGNTCGGGAHRNATVAATRSAHTQASRAARAHVKAGTILSAEGRAALKHAAGKHRELQAARAEHRENKRVARNEAARGRRAIASGKASAVGSKPAHEAKPESSPVLQRGKYEWKQNHTGKWAWHDKDKQISGAYHDHKDADHAFESHGLKGDSPAAIHKPQNIKDHPEYDRLNRAYGHMSEHQINDRLEGMKREIAAHHHAAEREFDGNGGRRTGAAVSAQAARDIGQERLLLQMYASEKAARTPPTRPSSSQAHSPPTDKGSRNGRLGVLAARHAAKARSLSVQAQARYDAGQRHQEAASHGTGGRHVRSPKAEAEMAAGAELSRRSGLHQRMSHRLGQEIVDPAKAAAAGRTLKSLGGLPQGHPTVVGAIEKVRRPLTKAELFKAAEHAGVGHGGARTKDELVGHLKASVGKAADVSPPVAVRPPAPKVDAATALRMRQMETRNAARRIEQRGQAERKAGRSTA
jgi:hypothetical protein